MYRTIKLSQLMWLFPFFQSYTAAKTLISCVLFMATVLSWAKYSGIIQHFWCNNDHPVILWLLLNTFRSCLSCCSFLSDNHWNRCLFYGGMAVNVSPVRKDSFRGGLSYTSQWQQCWVEIVGWVFIARHEIIFCLWS